MIARIALHAVTASVGVVIGATLVLTTMPAPAAVPAPTSSAPATEVKAAPLPEADGGILLAWSPGELPADLATTARTVEGVGGTATVHAGRLELSRSRDASGSVVDDTEPGWSIPLDAIAVDPATFAPFVPTGERPLLERLDPGSVLLGSTSAALRRIGVGGQLEFAEGDVRTVAGVIDDGTVGAAEVVLHADDGAAEGFPPRYLLLRHDGDRGAVESALHAAAGGDPLRVRAPGETPFLRHGDAVLPQALVKARYGEFHYRRPDPGSLAFEPDPTWVARNIETRTLPILGSVTCHRSAFGSLEAALTELDRRGLAHTVDPSGFEGCWNPRLIAADGGLSRHAWGIAIDLNASGNPTGTGSGQDPALVELLRAHGWGWGGTWLVPDPMHFELVDLVSLSPIKVMP